MRTPVPTSRAARTAPASWWDLLWALLCPLFALYLRDGEIFFNRDWSPVAPFWWLSAAFFLAGFFVFGLHGRLARYFCIRALISISKAVIFSELLTVIVLFLLTR